MLTEGARAPDFELPGVQDGEVESFDLTDALADDRAVLLLFFPFDFSPVCTDELCAIRDARWFEFTAGLDVWGVSADSTYAHRAFKDEYDLNFPLLSDSQGTVASEFGVRYDEWEAHEGVPKRSVFLVSPDRTVEYAWATDHAYEKPDFVPVKGALDELAAIDESLVLEDVELDVNYDGTETYT